MNFRRWILLPNPINSRVTTHLTLRSHLHLDVPKETKFTNYLSENECESASRPDESFPNVTDNTALGSCDRASRARYEDRKTNKMQQLDVYY